MRKTFNRICVLSAVSVLTITLAQSCSPNAASINKASLRGGGQAPRMPGAPEIHDVDQASTGGGIEFTSEFYGKESAYSNQVQQGLEKDDVHFRISREWYNRDLFDRFRKDKSIDIYVDGSKDFTPKSSWVLVEENLAENKLDTSDCRLIVTPLGEGQWRIALNSECKESDRILKRMKNITVKFHGKRVRTRNIDTL